MERDKDVKEGIDIFIFVLIWWANPHPCYKDCKESLFFTCRE